MSLQDIANSTLQNFDPKKDSINSNRNGLPEGEYTVTVEDINHQVYDSGYDCIRIVFQAIDGEHAGEKEFYNISFAETSSKGKAIPDFILDRNVKFIAALGNLLDVQIAPTVFASQNETDIHDDIAKLLSPKKGTLVKLAITERPNKKDPSNPYKQYELGPAEQANPLDIQDDDLPF